MKLVFVTNLVHHHQTPIADEFYKAMGDDYKYVCTEPLPGWLIKGGYDPTISRPYIIRAYESEAAHCLALKLAEDADVVIIGDASESYVEERVRQGKMTFRYSERWFKNRPWYLSGPKAWRNFYKYHILNRNKPLYMLAASAYTCRDVNAIGAYKNKVFKWGYFTQVGSKNDVEASQDVSTSGIGTHTFMWCSRYLKWKHPELPVILASRLKKRGYDVVIDMFGSGVELEPTKELAAKLGVTDIVNFKGNVPNEEILEAMRQHDVFLFTSDKNEGWGAVLNESMDNGCAVVASDQIGAVPFLVEDGVNGLVFKSQDLDSLEEKVVSLLDNPEYRWTISKNAEKTMRTVWSPANAAKQFLQLVGALKKGDKTLIPKKGPCSVAERL